MSLFSGLKSPTAAEPKSSRRLTWCRRQISAMSSVWSVIRGIMVWGMLLILRVAWRLLCPVSEPPLSFGHFPRERGQPGRSSAASLWIPASTGMTCGVGNDGGCGHVLKGPSGGHG